jgi:photosystem II stability/assembly factor-like uncharacterized protein
LVCLFMVLAACSSGGHSAEGSAGNGTKVTSSAKGDSGGDHTDGDGDQGDTDQGDSGDDDGGAGDPDADLPGSDRGPELPEDPFLQERVVQFGVPSLKTFDAAAAQAALIRSQTARLDPSVARASWKFLGPKNVGGRVVDAAVDPQQKGGLYVATSTAGVWHSTDSGQTFTSTWPTDVTHAMGAIAIAPNGTLYAGTGETNPGGGSITYGGDGIYRSSDGGKTWQHVGLASSGTIGRIVVDPTNAKHIWVAASGNLFVPGGQRGVYVSTDGGNTWKRSFAPPNNTTGAVDITIDPKNPDHVIAALWDHQRKPDKRRYTGRGSGIWQTTNDGKTWQRLGSSQGLPAPSGDTGRIGVAFAPSDAKRVYAIYANNKSGSFENFFVSNDGGASWTRPDGADNLSGSQSTYGWWFARVFVDPSDADHLYVAGLNMYQSTNGADSFSSCCNVHADQHILVWDTHKGGDMYIGNDGGLYASSTSGSTWTHSDDQPWSQYDSLDVSEQDPTRFIGGLQDNGTRASWTSPPFQDVTGGDGQKALIDPKDDSTYYGCYQYGNCTGFSSSGQFTMPFQSQRFPFLMQMELQPGDPSVIYGGGNELNRSTDGGRTFTVLTGDLGHGGGHSASYPYGTLSAIGLSASNPKVIYLGTDNGYLYRSTDKAAHFTQLPPPIKSRPWISRITIEPSDANSVYIAFSGYRSGNDTPYLLHSSDGGKTWTNISANLPKAPVDDVVVAKGQLYVATDVGVFTSSIKGPNWRSLGHGLPQAIVTDLRYVPENSTLYAATFGMGVWSVKL